MRFVTFSHAGAKNRPGVVDAAGQTIVDLGEEGIVDLNGLVQQGEAGLDIARRALKQPKRKVPLTEAVLGAPIPRPRRNIMCVGKNYFEHSKEFEKSGFDSTSGGQAVPDAPVIFTKAPSSVSAPGAEIPSYLDPTQSTDYEGELGVVIGRGGRGIAKDAAYGHVFGYVILNDVTARKLQSQHKQWFLGKSVDGFCPMGPYLVTADEVGDVTKLVLTTEVNGERRQEGKVSDLIFDIPTIIETISRTMTLEPGDVIATGTPAGVGIGFNPPQFLKKGDIVRIAITGLGVLENPVA
jgi:2-keto-4-pentenoate hydratase/2-oxohepta-3-ene-1,7-dioic acid hydratase in catechol pathway